MYYKIQDQESEVYKQLHTMRTEEHRMGKTNIIAIEEKTGMTWKSSLANHGQQTFTRVTEYTGFKFIETEKINPKIWKEHKEIEGIYTPNNRTKLGREMARFLTNGLEGSSFFKAQDILGLESMGRTKFPFIEICGDVIILSLDPKQEPDFAALIEITKVEFNSIYYNSYGKK